MKDKHYEITFKGLLSTALSEDATAIVLEAVHAKLYQMDCNAIIFERNKGGEFSKVCFEKERKI